MIKVQVKNSENQILASSYFKDQAQADAWLANARKNQNSPWGRHLRTVELDAENPVDESLILSSEVKVRQVLDEEQGFVDEQYTLLTLKADYAVEIEDLGDEKTQEQKNREARAYLASTDWLIIRELDSGEECPAEIKAERAAARSRIVN